MAWTNDTQHSPYQYSHQASNAFLTAIGSGLGIDTPMKYILPSSTMLPLGC